MYNWIFKNTFSSKLLTLNPNINLNINKIREFKYIDNFGKLICNNIENINHKKFLIQQNSIYANLSVIENIWKYPFPNNYIPLYYNIFKLDMSIDYKNKTYFINEYMKINIHYPSPYNITCKYHLKIDDNFIESRKIKGQMNYKTLESYLITNHEAKELFEFVKSTI